MFSIFWVSTLILTFYLYFKTIEWQTISRLGFPSETPAVYIQKGRLYHYFCYALFTLCTICAFFISAWLLLAVVAGWLVVEVIGRSKGIKIYRGILKDLIASSENKLGIEKMEMELKKTDLEIWKLANREKRRCQAPFEGTGMTAKQAKLLIFYGAFLIGAGVAGFLSNPEKAKTALLSGGTFGGLSMALGYLGFRRISWSLAASRISTSFLSVVFLWRSFATWNKVIQDAPEKIFAAVLITLMLTATLAMGFVLFGKEEKRTE